MAIREKRTEYDSIGAVDLDARCLFGIQTARAVINFPVSGRPVRREWVRAIVDVKRAAATANRDAGLLAPNRAEAILYAADLLLSTVLTDPAANLGASPSDSALSPASAAPSDSAASSADPAATLGDVTGARASRLPDAFGGFDFASVFPTDAFQGGAGTSIHMNVNEVLANIGLIFLGHLPGEYAFLHPLDDVNLGQSTNDVCPTSLRVAAIRAVRDLSEELSSLQKALQTKEEAFSGVVKLGRTQLMDALPITLGEEFGAYAQAIARDRWRIYKVEERLRQTNLGGTAVGTGANASRKYAYLVIERLREDTGLSLAAAEYPMDLTQNGDVFVEVSGLLSSCAVNLMKISSDLRLMNSGPRGGFSEIHLENRQAGSTIMAGKVNPVIPEMVAQVSFQVMANHQAITTAAMSGQLELNAFVPLIADRLLESLELLVRAVSLFRRYAVETLRADEARCRDLLDGSLVLTTALIPRIGYDEAARIQKEALLSGKSIRDIAKERTSLTKEELDALIGKPAARPREEGAR